MGVVVYIEIGTAAAIYSKKNQIEDIVDYGLNKTLYKSNANKDYYDTMHLLQSEVRRPFHFMHEIIQFYFFNSCQVTSKFIERKKNDF